MADTNEIICDIIAEMRNTYASKGGAGYCGEVWIDLLRYADRLEAAHKREMSKNVSKNGADFGQLGNAAKLREAVLALKELDFNKEEDCYDFYRIIDAALAEPPRNCDVGTAEEQDERFHRFCVEHHTGSCAGCHNPVGDYTVANGVRECALVWAQMPYEEGGAK